MCRSNISSNPLDIRSVARKRSVRATVRKVKLSQNYKKNQTQRLKKGAATYPYCRATLVVLLSAADTHTHQKRVTYLGKLVAIVPFSMCALRNGFADRDRCHVYHCIRFVLFFAQPCLWFARTRHAFVLHVCTSFFIFVHLQRCTTATMCLFD